MLNKYSLVLLNRKLTNCNSHLLPSDRSQNMPQKNIRRVQFSRVVKTYLDDSFVFHVRQQHDLSLKHLLPTRAYIGGFDWLNYLHSNSPGIVPVQPKPHKLQGKDFFIIDCHEDQTFELIYVSIQELDEKQSINLFVLFRNKLSCISTLSHFFTT